MNTRSVMHILRFSKGLLSLLLSVLILLGTAPMAAAAAEAELSFTGVAYELWLGSTQVTSGNQYDIFGTGQASFDPDTNTLTLSNPSIKGVYTDESGATYKIASKNTDLIIKGSYRMADAEAQYGAASVGGALTLDGDFSFYGTDTGVSAYDNVNVQSGRLFASGDEEYGIFSAMGNVRIEPDVVKVDANGGISAITTGEFEGYTLLLGGVLYISEPKGAKIEKENSGSEHITNADGSTATHATIEPNKQYDLWLGGTRVCSKNASDIFGDGKAKYSPVDCVLTLSDPVIEGFYCDGNSFTHKIYSGESNLTIKGSYHMTAAGEHYGVSSTNGRLSLIGDFTFMGTMIGARAKYDIDVKSGTLKAVGGDVHGMFSEQGNIMLESMVKRVEATGGEAGIYAEGNKLYLSEDHRLIAPSGGSLSDCYIREADGSTVAKRFVVESIGRYGLWLGETQVTSENAGDICGDGKASFDASTGTLTLSEPDIPGIQHRGSYTYKIYAYELDLTVKGTYRMTGSEADWGIVCDYGDLTLNGDFVFYGGSKSAVGCNQNITLDGNISAYGGDKGVMAYENITLGGGYLNFYNSDIGISSLRKVTFMGDSAMIVIYSEDRAVSADEIEIVNTGDEHLMIKDPYEGRISDDGDTIVDTEGNAAKVVTLRQPSQYALWVGSTRVTDLNKYDVLGDGKVSFNPMTNTLTLSDPNITGSFTDSYGRTHKIYASNLYLTVKGSYHMGWAETAHGITADRGTVVLEGSFTFQGTQNGVYADSDVIVRGGSLKAFGVQGTGIYGGNNLYVFENVPFIEAQGGTRAVYFITGGMSLPDETTIASPSGGMFKNPTVYESNGTTIAKYVYLKTVKRYDLWVGGNRVTDDNKNDICGDGKASFDPETGVLTLNDAYVTGTCEDESGIGTKFFAKGFDLTVRGGYHMSWSDTQIGIEIQDGKLTLDGDFDFRGTYVGLMARNASVTLTGNMLLQGGSHNGISVYGGELIIKDAKIKAYAGNFGIDVNMGVSVSGDSYVTMDGGIAALNGASSLEMSAELGITEPESAGFSAGDKTIIDKNSARAKHAVIDKKPVETRLLGDADGNGTVNIFDAAHVQKGLTGTGGYPSYASMDKNDIAYRAADVDGDGTVNIFDASIIQKYLTGSAYAQGYGVGEPIR